MENLQLLSNKRKRNKTKLKESSKITSPLISKPLYLNINLAMYLSEYLNVIDLIEFAYTNRFYLRIKNPYIEKIETLKINCGDNSDEIDFSESGFKPRMKNPRIEKKETRETKDLDNFDEMDFFEFGFKPIMKNPYIQKKETRETKILDNSDEIDISESAYSPRMENPYIEKKETLKINCDEIEYFNSKIFENNPSLFKNLKNLSCSNYKLKKKNFKSELNSLQMLKIDSCGYFDIYSSFKNIQQLEIKNSRYGNGLCIFSDFNKLNIEGIKHIVLKNMNLSYSYYIGNNVQLDPLFLIKNLETLDLSCNYLSFGGLEILERIQELKNLKILNLEECSIELTKESIENIIRRDHNIESLNISYNIDFSSNKHRNTQIWQEISYLLLQRNKSISGSQKLKIIHDNLILPEEPQRMRMLFSRSGVTERKTNNFTPSINSQSSIVSKESLMTHSTDILGKVMGSKPNGAILPQIIYDSPSKIEFTKDMLIEILKIENKIRLSNQAKDLFDLNKLKGLSVHLRLDREMIKSALEKYGFKPEEDDSLKAYHLATTRFVHDEEVRNAVVWMKYDKCKVGNYSVNDCLNFDGIKLYEFNGNVCLLKDLLCKTRPNLIVSGSMS